jgi:hypothetical protein
VAISEQKIPAARWQPRMARIALAALALLCACASPPPSAGPVTTTTPVILQRPGAWPGAAATPGVAATPDAVDPVKQAWQWAQLGRKRLERVPADPELNGYYDLILIAPREGGLLNLWELVEGQGAKALLKRLAGGANADDGPLAADMSKLAAGFGKRTVAVPAEIPKSGPVTLKNAKAFEALVAAMAVVPLGDSDNPDAVDQLQTDLFALGAARKIALDASCLKHYLLGLELQKVTLREIARTVKSGSLKASLLRDLIARIQEQRGGVQEMLEIADADYFLALRAMEGAALSPAQLAREQSALAARYLKMRPHLLEEKPPRGGFVFTGGIPEMAGTQLAARAPDALAALGRSRLAATHMGALELLCGLEVWKREKGGYPARLDDLVPSVLSRMPVDRLSADGKYVYRRAGKGYRLETVSKALPELKSGRIAW